MVKEKMNVVRICVATIMGLFFLYSTVVYTLEPQMHRFIFLTFVLVLLYLSKPLNKEDGMGLLDIFCALLPVVIFIYYYFFKYEEFITRWRFAIALPWDEVLMFIVLLILIFEGTRRVVGMPLALISFLFLIYNFLGPYMPGVLYHRGHSLSRILSHMFVSTDGVLGVPIYVASTYMILFILFGAFLVKTGVGEYFLDLAIVLAGRAKGGNAKIAVVASALMGSISGSPVANTLTTGSFTIPAMIKQKYLPHFASGVEAAASCGGTILPPIMGAVAFLVAEFVGISYYEVIIAALFPALLYYVSVYTTIHIEALKFDIQEEGAVVETTIKENIRKVLLGSYNLIPIILILVMLVQGYSAILSAFWALVSSFLLSFLKKETRMTIPRIISALESGCTKLLPVGIACASAGIIIGTVSLTGLGGRLSSLIIGASGGYVILGLFFVMVVTIILGMGMSISPTFIMAAVIGSRALVGLGVDRLAANMFVMYFAAMATITPPVSMSAYAAAGIAGASMTKSSYSALRIGIAGFIIPYMFVYSLELLMMGTAVQIVIRLITAMVGLIFLVMFLSGYSLLKNKELNWFSRLLVLFISISFIYPNPVSYLVGIVLIAVKYLIKG